MIGLPANHNMVIEGSITQLDTSAEGLMRTMHEIANVSLNFQNFQNRQKLRHSMQIIQYPGTIAT